MEYVAIEVTLGTDVGIGMIFDFVVVIYVSSLFYLHHVLNTETSGRNA